MSLIRMDLRKALILSILLCFNGLLVFELFSSPQDAYASAENLALHKTASSNAASCSAGEGPEEAVDDSIDTHWCSTAAGDKWLLVDLGATVSFNRWTVKHAQAADESPDYNTKSFKLQVSTDGVTFTDQDIVTDNTASITNRQIPLVSARYARLYVTAPTQNGSDTVRIKEFEIFHDTVPDPDNLYIFDIGQYVRNNPKAVYPLDSEDGTPAGRYVKLDVFKPNGYATDRMARVPEIELYDDIAMGKTAVASDSGSAEHGPSNAVDGRDDTSWSSSATGDRWLSVDLGAAKTVTRWVVKHAQAGGASAMLNTKDYKLQVSSDGLTYTDADTVLSNTAALTERTIPGVSGRYFRLYITDPNQTAGDPTVTINDFELYDAGNLALGSTVTASTGANPAWAADGNGSTQWTSSDTDSDIWLKVDLGSVKRFNRWVVKQAGSNGDPSDHNLFGYHLKVSEDDSADSYLMLDTVDSNTDGMTDRMINRSTFVKYKEYAYDFMKMAAAFQGIVNREGAHVFYKYEGSSEIAIPRGFEPDSYWLDKLSQPGQLLADKNQIVVTDFYSLLDLFSYKIAGIVTWDEEVSSTSNVASTVSGVEDLLPVRYDTGANSLYTELRSLTSLDVGVHLENKFTGAGTIWNTSTASTGSAKNDAYLWAKEKYLDTRRVSASLMQFAVDAWINPADTARYRDSSGEPYYNDLFNRMIINQDYYVQNKAFFFDLQPRDDYLPNDDPTQTMGTDYGTLEQIMSAMEDYADGTLFTVGGFSAWHLKYTDEVDPNGMRPIDSEWDMVTMISKHNGQLDADAPGLMALANASIYSQVPLDALSQNNDKGAGNTEAYDPDKRYVLFYMGDYDSAAWTAGELPALWDSANGRGSIPLAWSVVPGLSQRVPMVYNYLYGTATSKDYFVSGDNGAGYLNPIDLPSQYHEAWKDYTKNYFELFDLTIAGFVIPQWDAFIPLSIQREYAEIAPDGVGTPGEEKLVDGVPFLQVNQGIPAYNANAVEQGLLDMIANDPDAHFYNIRTTLADPQYITQGALQFLQNHPENNVEVVDPYTFYRLVKQYYSMNIRSADFDADGTPNELTYLSADNGSAVAADHRYAETSHSWTYTFDLDDRTNAAKVLLDIEGDYNVSLSRDETNWELALTAGGASSRATRELDLTPMLFDNPTRTVYVKFQDGTPATGLGVSLYHLNLNANYTQTADFDVDGGSEEALYLDKNFAAQQPGFKFADMKAFWVYKFSLAPAADEAYVQLDIWGDYVVSGSKDGATWTALASAGGYASRNWLTLDLSGLLADNPEKIVYLKFADRTTEDGGGPALAHVTLRASYDEIGTDTKHILGELPLLAEDHGSNIDVDHRFADGTAYWVYELNFASGTEYAQADLVIGGDYVISGSRDGIHWTVIKQKGSVASTESISLELSPFLVGNSTGNVYLKFSDRTEDDGYGPSLFHLHAYQKTSGSYGTFRIMNKWKGTFMNIENLDGTVEVNGNNWGDSSRWIVEDAGDGCYTIRNYWKPDYYLNMASLFDYVEYGTVSPSQDSAQWLLSDAGGFLRIKNKAEPADNIHIEDELGYAQYGGMTGDSSQWLLVPVYS